ncbi:butyrophilin subfamily 2 member A2-like [Archocentrus centrarchus]|uniref:butyrophilin subfamily 2 member A2-like n=1 Tax=Archocentrus centrarchus TaxID=63155 RepID=UPI0011E9C34C|nr:butyrophilin subfamily 2 member A2-like [Archocentrus centrarchus]
MRLRRCRCSCRGCRALLLHHVIVCLLLIPKHRGQPLVVGPSQAVVATVGEEIVLPCHIKPEMDASRMRLEWARPDLTPGFVHVWADNKEHVVNKQPSYGGRTSLMIHKLEHGDVSLKLSNVTVSDEGTYRCLVPQVGREVFIKLVVGAASLPFIRVMNRTSSRVVLQCESAGWYPEPELLWLDSEGNLLSAGPTETLRGPDDLYTVSSRVTVEKRHSNNITCRVQQKNINQSRDMYIHLPVLSWYVKLVLVPCLFSVFLAAVLTVHGRRLRIPGHAENEAMIKTADV